MGEKKIASIRPSPLASVVGIIGGLAALVIGIFFLAGVPGDAGESGFKGIFFFVWFLACVGIIVYYARNLATFSAADKGRIPLTAEEVVEVEPEKERPAAGDFEARLRKLEALRRDNLIDEEEFKQKRKEIMDEKW